MNFRVEIERRLCAPIVIYKRRCCHCRDGRLVAQGDSYTAGQARKYDLCQRCYNDADTRHARRVALGLGVWRRS